MPHTAYVHNAPTALTSAPVSSNEQEALVLFAPNEALEKLLGADGARRFADLRSALRDAVPRHSPRRNELQHGALAHAAARLTNATKYYERHVLAWYALGRVSEARSAREAILRHRQALAAETRRIANIDASAAAVDIPAVADGNDSHEMMVLVEFVDDPVRTSRG